MNIRQASVTDTIDTLLKEIGDLVIAVVKLPIPKLTKSGNIKYGSLYGVLHSTQLDKNKIFPNLTNVKETLSDLLIVPSFFEKRLPYDNLQATGYAQKLKTTLECYNSEVRRCKEDSQKIHSALKSKIEAIEAELLIQVKEPGLVDTCYAARAKQYIQTKQNAEAKEAPIPADLILDWNEIADLLATIKTSEVPFVTPDKDILFTILFDMLPSFVELKTIIAEINLYDEGIQTVSNAALEVKATDNLKYQQFKSKVQNSDIKEKISKLKNKALAYEAALLTHVKASQDDGTDLSHQIKQLHSQVIEAWRRQLQSSPSLFNLPVTKSDAVNKQASKTNTLAPG